MNKKQAAKRICRALDNIDAELLYDARAYRAPRIMPYLRYAVAAVLVLAILSSALILSKVNTVKTYLTVDTNYGVTLELNADNRVVKATASASLYDVPAKACRNMGVDRAVDQLLDTMGERGGLNEAANTVIFGVRNDSEQIAQPLIDDLIEKKSCILRVMIDDESAAGKLAKKRRVTVGKAALLLSLSEADNGISENRLFRLSANDIALLAAAHGIIAEDVVMNGTPADGYLSKTAIRQIALDASGITPDRIGIILDSDGFRLIYTVLLYEGDRGAAYFIDASTGEIRSVVHGAADTLLEQVEEVREKFGEVSDNTPPANDTPAADTPIAAESSTAVLTEAETTAGETSATPTATPTATASPTESESTESESIPTEATAAPTEAIEPTEATEDIFLSTTGFFDCPDNIETYTQIEGTQWFTRYARYDDDDTIPSALLIRSREELICFWSEHPGFNTNDTYYRNRFLDDAFFDDHAMLYATGLEYYENVDRNCWFASKSEKGEIVYIGLFDLNTIYTDSDDVMERDAPAAVTCAIELEGDFSNAKEIEIVRLTYQQVQKMNRL